MSTTTRSVIVAAPVFVTTSPKLTGCPGHDPPAKVFSTVTPSGGGGTAATTVAGTEATAITATPPHGGPPPVLPFTLAVNVTTPAPLAENVHT